MTELHLDADRMPDVARGAAQWSAEELRHLGHCDQCRSEWAMVQVAAGLGRGVARRLGSARIADTVARRLASEPPPRRTLVGRTARLLAAGMAAAAAIAVFGSTRLDPPLLDSPATQSVLHELDELNPAELETLLESLPPEAGATAHPEPATVNELDTSSLERLLRSLEG